MIKYFWSTSIFTQIKSCKITFQTRKNWIMHFPSLIKSVTLVSFIIHMFNSVHIQIKCLWSYWIWYYTCHLLNIITIVLYRINFHSLNISHWYLIISKIVRWKSIFKKVESLEHKRCLRCINLTFNYSILFVTLVMVHMSHKKEFFIHSTGKKRCW